MPTKVRAVFEYGGSWYQGGVAKKQLEYYLDRYLIKRPVKIKPSWKNLQKMYEELAAIRPSPPMNLWVFREKKNTQPKKSRFKLICRYIGVGQVIFSKKDKKKKKGSGLFLARIPTMRGVRNARNNRSGVPPEAVSGRPSETEVRNVEYYRLARESREAMERQLNWSGTMPIQETPDPTPTEQPVYSGRQYNWLDEQGNELGPISSRGF